MNKKEYKIRSSRLTKRDIELLYKEDSQTLKDYDLSFLLSISIIGAAFSIIIFLVASNG